MFPIFGFYILFKILYAFRWAAMMGTAAAEGGETYGGKFLFVPFVFVLSFTGNFIFSYLRLSAIGTAGMGETAAGDRVTARSMLQQCSQ